ncbi:hypothetical protein DFH06DRAFT_1440143 [Mycena polygramma]|nr:hypothetical protein DFH06DRAFT_1440143 [Mycena polygramma]
MDMIRKLTTTNLSWYQDPFRSSADESQSPPVVAGAHAGRNKFSLLHAPEMPSPISSWENALKAVDTSVPTQTRTTRGYVFPEPALVVSSKDPARRQLYLHHLSLIFDALACRVGNEEDPRPLNSQEWREVLQGQWHAAAASAPSGMDSARGGYSRQGGGRGGEPTKSAKRKTRIHQLLGRSFHACGLSPTNTNPASQFPASPGAFPPIPTPRAQQLLWTLAESNFRFEFLALDRRASKLHRPDLCQECFAGGMLLGMPLALAMDGLAALEPSSRHIFVGRIARLMEDWDPRPRAQVILGARDKRVWRVADMLELESEVAKHYAQTFFEYFGRAAVVPMRLGSTPEY